MHQWQQHQRLRMMFSRKSRELNLILSSLLSAICTSQAYQIFNFVVNINFFFLFFQCWSSRLEKKRAFLSIMLKLTHKSVDNQTTSIPPPSKIARLKISKQKKTAGIWQLTKSIKTKSRDNNLLISCCNY